MSTLMDEKAVSTFLLRRRAASLPLPSRLAIPHSHHNGSYTASSSSDVELLSITEPTSPTYTSLKDLIPSVNANSPRPISSAHEARPIYIRNRLVKRAAWAYLMPTMSVSPGPEGGWFSIGSLWPRVAVLLDRIRRGVAWVVEWALRVVRVPISR